MTRGLTSTADWQTEVLPPAGGDAWVSLAREIHGLRSGIREPRVGPRTDSRQLRADGAR